MTFSRFPANRLTSLLQKLGKPILIACIILGVYLFLLWTFIHRLANHLANQLHHLSRPKLHQLIRNLNQFLAKQITLNIPLHKPRIKTIYKSQLKQPTKFFKKLKKQTSVLRSQLKLYLHTLKQQATKNPLTHSKTTVSTNTTLLVDMTTSLHDHATTFSRQLRKQIQKLLQYVSLRQLKTHLPKLKPLPHIFAVSLKIFYVTITVNLFLFSIIYLGFNIYQFVFLDLPHPQQLLHYEPPATTKIFDRHGTLLFQVFEDQNRIPVNIDELPPHIIQAHIAIEDKNFYNHIGLSFIGISRAIKQAWDTGEFTSGGSTITQQLIKNTLLTPDRTWPRKFKEGILALWTERMLTKHQILDLYLNNISYGGTAYGIEAAARQYFDKGAADLNLAETALLAGLPAAPSAYSPFGGQPDKAIERQRQVLGRMLEDGYITSIEYEQALNQPLAFSTPANDIEAPHFVMYVRDQIETQLGLDQMYQGLEIYTSLDLNLQNKAQEILAQELEYLKNLNVTNGAILITKPATGEILAMVGSANYFDTTTQGNFNATTALRQPGSSIKPLTYAAALAESIPSPLNSRNPTHKTYTAASIINDSPVTFNIAGSQPYSPKNYDGRYHGNVTIRTALASSYNIPAVKTLDDIGIPYLLEFAKQMGISTWTEPERYGLSLTLGGAEVKMVDMATLYGIFANLGIRKDLNPILQIKGLKTDHLPPSPFQDPNYQAIDARVAFIMNHILSDNNARIPAFGSNSKLNISNEIVAVKTGTTNSMRDNWTIGYTPDYLVAVWVGNFDNTPMSRIASGITGATPIWHNVMNYLLKEFDPEAGLRASSSNQFPWIPPEGLVQVAICPYTGTLPCNGCPTKEEWFIQGTQPTSHCVVKPTDSPENPHPQFEIRYDTIENNRFWPRERRARN